MLKSLSFKDLINLEYFIAIDKTSDTIQEQEKIKKRDRELYNSAIEPKLNQEKAKHRHPNRFILTKWLEKRQEINCEGKGFSNVLPGDLFQQAYTTLLLAIVLLSLFIGGGTALTYIAYFGKDPVNVSVYIFVFIIFQICIFIFTLFILLFWLYNRGKTKISLWQTWLHHLLTNLLFRALRVSSSKLEKSQRDYILSIGERIKEKNQAFNPIIRWSLFNLIQLGTVAFNCGVLGATFFRVLISDLAFGWQSTFPLTSKVVHSFVSAISLPWSWFISSNIAHPSLKQIEGTRIVLKEGISHLATQDLVSWWPFLCFAVFFYGICPRVSLFLAGKYKYLQALKRFDFNRVEYQELIWRMTSPLVSLSTNTESGNQDQRSSQLTTALTNVTTLNTTANETETSASVVLIANDIAQAIITQEKQELVDLFSKKYRLEAIDFKAISFDLTNDRDIIQQIDETNRLTLPVILEAWQPPIRETLLFFEDLLKSGICARVLLVFIGKPERNKVLTKTDNIDVNLWVREIEKLHEPRILIDSLL